MTTDRRRGATRLRAGAPLRNGSLREGDAVARETTIWVIGFGWFATVLGGFWIWERYEGTPGAVGPGAAAAETEFPTGG